MGKKVFVSYKYADACVLKLDGIDNTTVRHYVDILGPKLEDEHDHIYKGENDGESMGTLEDSTIGSKLGDKIFDSSVTIVLISKGMKENKPDKEQWIPWEISYSLKEQSREGGRSKTNAVLAVVLPDENGSYEYYITYNAACNSRTLNTPFLFQILSDNMFNHKNREANGKDCNGTKIYTGAISYIHSVKWQDFINDINSNLDFAIAAKENINDYELVKTIQ